MSLQVKERKNFVIDFDSTFTKVEALDILCEISQAGNPDKDKVLKEIEEVTNLGMEGKLSLRDSLERRIVLLGAKKAHLTDLINRLSQLVSESFERNKAFLKENAEDIYIVSNGFRDFIDPVVMKYGIKQENIFANTFVYDENDVVIGFDRNNVLSSNNGKVKIIDSLSLTGEVYVIGDGYTDYEIRAAGLAHGFYAFTENISRPSVKAKADHIIPNLDEFLYLHKMNKAISYPKNRIKVLLLENVHPDAEKLFKEEGYDVTIHKAGMDEKELLEVIEDVNILGIRSKTQITKKVIEASKRLIAIGAFCIGTNQIDLESATEKGIAVFNAPYSNTRSVVELAIAEIIMLMRNLPDKISAMHQGEWKKSATGSFEVRGKTLGIIGYGNIGSQLSILAENMGMNVQYFDLEEKLPLGNTTKCSSLEELLQTSDVVSLHVDGRPENKNIFDATTFENMKDGAILVNLSRGHIVDIDALSSALKSGKLGGAAIDVFPVEPKSNNEEFISSLRNLPNLILTPHIGGSTLEAQKNIGQFVPAQIMEYINTGSTSTTFNFPPVKLQTIKNGHRLVHIHKNTSGVLAKINAVLANHNLNILGQHLKTNESVGYLITDVDKEYDPEMIKQLKEIDGTIWFRTIY